MNVVAPCQKNSAILLSVYMIKNKLVRDNIPAIVVQNGHVPVTRILEHDEYVEALFDKLSEEVAEATQDRTIDELADVQEVLQSIMRALGYSQKAVDAAPVAKRAKNGGFQQQIFLVEVI
jgi:predicted house-cleaning noncanonical NTP pyrophosphatase (MazG superfamily)